MRDHISEYLSASRPQEQLLRSLAKGLRWRAQHKGVYGKRGVKSYVNEYPVVAIGAAFFTGVFLAWMIKRK